MTAPAFRRVAAGPVAAAVAAAAVVFPATAVGQGPAVVVDTGHVDLVSPDVVDGRLVIGYHDDNTSPPTVRDPADVVTHVVPESRIQVPDLPDYAFLGPPGADLWLIPEIQDPDAVWAGWSTEELSADEVDPGSLSWTLESLGGDAPGSPAPGRVTVFASGPVGDPLPRVFDTAGALPQTRPLSIDTHAHANWTFSSQGVYRFTFSVSATTPGGGPLRATATYAIAVGDIDPTTVLPGTGVPPTTTTTPATTTGPTITGPTTTGPTTTRPTNPGGPCAVLSDGHVDLIAPRLLDGAVRTQVKDGTARSANAVWREPEDVVVHVVPAARNTVPTDPAYAFLGAPGYPVWLIPQTQVPGVVWAGWNTESLSPGQTAGDITLRVTAVDGPGPLAVFTSGPTPGVLVASRDGLPDTVAVAPGTHAHANWAFGAEGRYRLTVEVAVPTPDGRTLRDTDVFTVAVGAVDPTAGTDCTPSTTTPQTSSTTPQTPTTTVPPAPSATRGVQPQHRDDLAHTGPSRLGATLALAALLATGGTALLLLARRRTPRR